jgi:MoxR-like ATPase
MTNFETLFNKRVRPIEESLQKIMVGQRHVIRRITMSLYAVGQRDFHANDGSRFLGTGHILCEGPTGTGKSIVCKALSILLGGNNKRVSGVPDSVPSDVLGSEIILLTGDTKTVKGPLFCNVMLADEINRFSPKAQNAFIEALAEGSITIGNETYRLEQPFFCLATQNPTEQKGTSRLQEALSDRFMFKVVMQETSEEEKMEITRRTHKFDLTSLRQVVTSQDVYEAREYFFDNTYVSDDIRSYCARILTAINHPAKFGLYKEERGLLMNDPIFKQKPPVNDRAMLHLEGAAMMEAVMNQRDFVIPADVAAVCPDVLRVRLLLNESSAHTLMEVYSKSETELIDYFIDEALCVTTND